MNRHRPARALSRALSRALTPLSFSSSSASSSSSSSLSSFPLKHVTRSNFEAALAELRGHVRAADFVAIDLEMTGVTSAPWRDSFEFDRSDVRYLKVRDSAEKFAVVQFGVCPFRWDSSKNSFVAHPHNFYVFPRQELSVDGPSYEFLCQTASIDFLAKYQFDFNACIREGISYLSKRQEDEAFRHLNLAFEDESSVIWSRLKEVRNIPLVSMPDILFSERMKNRFIEWRDRLLLPQNGRFQFQDRTSDFKQFETIFFKMRPALSLNGFTSHQLKLVQLVVKEHFKDLSYVHFEGENSILQQLIVYTESKDDKDLLMKEVKNDHRRQAETKIQAAVGFRHVIDLLSSEKKLIVGHNCFLDIAQIYSKFIGPLPLAAEELASSVNKYFPHIIDTKILLNANHILQQRIKKSKTSLSSAFALLCPHLALSNINTGLPSHSYLSVEVEVDDLRSCNWNSGAKHEAGYDAFMTGCIFAQACSHLGIDFKIQLPSENLAYNERLQKQINLLYLSWTNGDVIDLSTGKKVTESLGSNILKKQYPKIVFENIVLLWGFPSGLKAREIRECITKVFGPTSVTSVYHLDETAVFVQFMKAEMVSDFLLLKEKLEKSDGPISVLHPLAKLLEGGSTHAASYETYKEICGSSISKHLFADQAEVFGIRWKTKLVESKAALDGEENGSLGKENSTMRTAAKAAHKTKHGVVDNLRDNSLCDQIIHSIYAAEDSQLRTTN
ncbi:poly(A)-specific ribonuclease PARN [Ziziphus jujuba]|uniref:Poly(A)-specific ribonuclease PARN n=1 Tax=Ziziphus jujuba TaxID=326968 RepID=A0A6P4AR82_ZIZJJ|nr:poly(A)-specific ribonuclease PARN [Ziziphus jujuba]